jgi:hypothetical protein
MYTYNHSPCPAASLDTTDVVLPLLPPSLLTDTVQENILLGSEVEPDRYRLALKVSQLGPDLDILPK